MLSAPEKSALIVPLGNQNHQLAMKYCRRQVQRSYHIGQCWVPLGKIYCHCGLGELSIIRWPRNIIPSGHHVQCWVPPCKSPLLLCPKRTQYHQLARQISPVDITLVNVECPWGRACCFCAPSELSITKWPWNNIISGHNIVQCSVPPGTSLLLLCHRRTNITSWIWNIITNGLVIAECSVPPGKSIVIVPQGNSVSPSCPWNIVTNRHHIVQCWLPPRKSLLSLCPRGIQYHQLARTHHHQRTCHKVQCWVPLGKSLLLLWPIGGLNMTSWLWNIIISGMAIMFIAECPRGSMLSLCPRGTQSQNHQLSLKYCCQVQRSYSIVKCWVPLGKSLLSLWPWETLYHQMAMKYYHHWTSYCLMLRASEEELTLMMHQDNSVSPTGYDISSPEDIILFNVECPAGILYSYCSPGELVVIFHSQLVILCSPGAQWG